MIIPKNYIQKLRSHGLFVAEPMPSNHVFPDGVLVGKPEQISGNYIPGYSTAFVLDLDNDIKVDFNAPPLWLYSNGKAWFVDSIDMSPGPGPGDFIDEWQTAEEAVDDILDFYFGDSRRMQTKAEARKKPVRNQS